MGKISVALIEDHDLTRISLRTAIQKCSELELVGEAINGAEGLDLLLNSTPNVGIVDIGLPDMDGIELTKNFKHAQESLPEASQTKILILTLQDEEDAVLAAFAAGADSYCMKDCSFDKLLDALKITEEGNSWIDPVIAKFVLSQANKTSSQNLNSASDNPQVKIQGTDPEYSQLIEAYPLTERELEVLQLIVEGYSNAAIAEHLYITVGTVKTHVRNILNKLCADDRTQAAVRALRSGLVG